MSRFAARRNETETGFEVVEIGPGQPHDIDAIAEFIVTGDLGGALLVVLRARQGAEFCAALARQFTSMIARTGSDRDEDGFVRTQQIGATQFARGGRAYVTETMRHAPHVLDLFGVLPPDTVRSLFLDAELEPAFLRRGMLYRPALHLSGSANFATTRRWLNNGEMALHPHEDSAQLAFAAEDGFEIAGGRHTIAVNLCLADDGSELVVWNLRPDLALRRTLGLEKTGYPYPLDLVNGHECLSVRLNPGDLYFLNASYVHGVRNSAANARITSGRFLTPLDDKVVYWT